MANEDVVKQIKDAAKLRVRTMVDVFVHSSTETNNEALLIGAALQALVDSWREEADLWTNSKRRGWQGTAKELRQVAARVAGVMVDLNELAKAHGTGVGAVDPSAVERLDDLTDVAGTLDATVSTQFVPENDDVTAYLRGDIDTIPGVKPAPVNPAPASADVAAYLAGDDQAKPTLNAEARAMTNTFPITPADPFLDPAPYVPATRPPFPGAEAHRYDFGKLMTPVDPIKMPDHWSWSQLTSMEDCGLKYRAERVERVPTVPQWAHVGGNALHKATETLDRRLATLDRANWPAPSGLNHDTIKIWREAFGAEITDEFLRSGIAPGDDGNAWRASNSGKEGYTWWLVEGETMLAGYAKQRLAERDLEPLVVGDRPVIEYATSIKLDGPTGPLEVQMVIDRAYRLPDGRVLIVDLKTGRTPPDDAQLSLYARALVEQGVGASAFVGRFWDARRQMYTADVDLLAAHDRFEFVYRFHTAQALRSTGLFLPRRSTFCGGCAVRYACPVGG